ncbi:hypothetical protein CONLIGDRAFT_101303 [Coniochaeta ligniaria NRRL 30616]|uniref:Granulins domain-containing protein n=1 Tax=Coniochaeta ligniaria NRRL 30616 TaxID=1408157 RepID=A0A1J7JAP3_9PEZI|nr:hypothetical protein CONLIGDRAFT_101303 [Coniochaeta ligniaria NRRL 30616]
MLIPTGLSTLLVGISAVTGLAAPSSPTFAPGDSSAPIPRPRNLIARILRSSEVQDHDCNGKLPASVPAQLISVPLRRRDRRWTGLFSRDDGCSPETTTVCSGSNGTGFACSGCSTCCPATNGGYQCCQQGFRCCLTSTGAGSCCPDDGSSCAEGGCGSIPGMPLGPVFETVTVTTTVTSFTASRTIGKYNMLVHNAYEVEH